MTKGCCAGGLWHSKNMISLSKYHNEVIAGHCVPSSMDGNGGHALEFQFVIFLCC